MSAPIINGKKAECVIELKDQRHLITYDNGFTYYVQSAKGEMTEVTEKYFKKQLKHRVKRKLK